MSAATTTLATAAALGGIRTFAGDGDSRHDTVRRFLAVRRSTEWLCEPLVTEDYVVQSMPDVSPAKWHLAHTGWFFETFILTPHSTTYRPFDPAFTYLFNSYYVTVGDRHCRQNRGLLSRPTVREVYAYRAHVNEGMRSLLEQADEATLSAIAPLLEIGLHHEQQHQELMLTDIKHVFWVNPLRPAYRPPRGVDGAARPPRNDRRPVPSVMSSSPWISCGGGLVEIGHDARDGGFAFDNESPRHKVHLPPFQMASRLVTNGQFKSFIADGGYQRTDLWLSLGAAAVQAEQWRAPLYWIEEDGQWLHHALSGVRPVDDDEPVCHISQFEADAFARWAGARLPTEAEWEHASESVAVDGPFVDAQHFHPVPAPGGSRLRQMFGDVWQWTASAYLGYPGYRPPAGALGEYNGKFMCNQFVLRGGSCATPRSHMRRTYRNFFPPEARWQFSGVRLAQDA